MINLSDLRKANHKKIYIQVENTQKNLSDHHTSVSSIQINFEQEPHYIKSNHKFHKNHKKHKNLNKNKTTKYRGHPYVNLQKTQKKSKTHE